MDDRGGDRHLARLTSPETRGGDELRGREMSVLAETTTLTTTPQVLPSPTLADAGTLKQIFPLWEIVRLLGTRIP
jgi:hypothetical protein